MSGFSTAEWASGWLRRLRGAAPRADRARPTVTESIRPRGICATPYIKMGWIPPHRSASGKWEPPSNKNQS